VRPRRWGETPVGSVVAFAGELGAPMPATAQPPGPTPSGDAHVTRAIEASGWMLCDGRELACCQYPHLSAALGRRYGGSEEEGTFKLPDYRGYFLRAVDNGRHPDGGGAGRAPPPGGNGTAAQVGSVQADAVQDHQHAYTQPVGATVVGNTGDGAAMPGPVQVLSGGPTDQAPPGEPVAGTVRIDAETRPVNMYVHYLIKWTYDLRPTFPPFPP
jgi:hypothetical protein